MAKKIDIGGELHSIATGNIVADAKEIKYRPTGKEEKTQAQVNDELTEAVGSGGGVDARIASAVNAAKAEIKGNATSACDTLGEAEALISAETSARQSAISNVIGDAASDYNTLGKLEDKIQAEATRAEAAESNLNSGKADKATTLAGYGITDAYTKSETYTKTEVHGLVDTPHQNYVTVEATSSTTKATDVLPASGQSADTIYRVSNWDGSANSGAGTFDATSYSEYAWDDVSDPNKYVFLCVKSQIGEVFDISVYNNNAKYADLAAALNGGANIPQSLQKGGMSVKFVQSSDNKYVQCRLMADSFSTTVSDWQGVDDVPTAGSNNLVKSGGVAKAIIPFTGVDLSFVGGTSSYLQYPLSLPEGKYQIKNTTGTFATISDNNNTEIVDIKDYWTDWTEVIITAAQAAQITKIKHLYGNGSVFIKSASVNEKLEDLKERVADDEETMNTLVPIAGGNNLLTEVIQGKYINSGGAIKNDSDHSIGSSISNKIYFNGHKKLYNNAYISGMGVRNGIYAEDGTILGVSNSEIIDATNYSTASYAICTVFLNNVNLPVRPQITYGDKPQPYSPYSPIQGRQIEYIEVTCNSDANSGADYVGNTAVRDAIAAITDASYFKRYILKCRGLFKATVPTDYQFGPDNVSRQYAMFWLKDYIYIDGIERNSCVFYSSLPDTIVECQQYDATFGNTGNTYGEYQPLFLSVYPSRIKNATFIAHNTRYPLHICNGNPNPQQGSEILVENCNLIHEGKFGDAVGTIGGSASGFGSANGVTCIFRNCHFKTYTGEGLYFHDSNGYTDAVTFVFDGCFVSNTLKTGSVISIHSFSNKVGNKVVIKNTKFTKVGTVTIDDLGNASENEMADTVKTDAEFDFEARPLNIGSSAIALKVEAVNDNSTVRFNPASSAFDLIVGDLSDSILQTANKYNRCQQYGYQWRDGGANLKGEAIGFRNLDAGKSLNLGVRLGDCSVTSKALGIIVNGTEYTVTFNRDYTSVSNNDIIAEINAVISTVATASLYNVNNDWYTVFKGVQWAVVDDAGSILRGMGVVYTENGVRKATSNDDGIDGIAIDSGVNGSQIRIVTCGTINFNGCVCPLLSVNANYWNVAFGTKYRIDPDNDGKFVQGTENAVLEKGVINSIEIL